MSRQAENPNGKKFVRAFHTIPLLNPHDESLWSTHNVYAPNTCISATSQPFGREPTVIIASEWTVSPGFIPLLWILINWLWFVDLSLVRFTTPTEGRVSSKGNYRPGTGVLMCPVFFFPIDKHFPDQLSPGHCQATSLHSPFHQSPQPMGISRTLPAFTRGLFDGVPWENATWRPRSVNPRTSGEFASCARRFQSDRGSWVWSLRSESDRLSLIV